MTVDKESTEADRILRILQDNPDMCFKDILGSLEGMVDFHSGNVKEYRPEPKFKVGDSVFIVDLFLNEIRFTTKKHTIVDVKFSDGGWGYRFAYENLLYTDATLFLTLEDLTKEVNRLLGAM